jgi:hypothetical protein
MSGLSKNQKSIRKSDLTTQTNTALGAKSIIMAHKASNGDTSIDLENLVFPSAEYDGTSIVGNPSYAEIAALKLGVNHKNLTIRSSNVGVLLKTQYKVVNSKLINFVNGFTAIEGEVFEMTFEPAVIGGATIVDYQPQIKTYLLPEGQTDVVVEPFLTNQHPTQQVGAVKVYRQIDPSGPVTLMLRDINNAGDGSGNYYEVPSNGYTSVIRFNTPAPVGGHIVFIESVGQLVERPTQSMMAFIEAVNGDVDKLRDTVAALSGQPKGNFNGQPHSIDLANFGTAFNDLNSKYDTDKNLSEYTKFKVQTKILSGLHGTNDEITELRFNNLEIGKWYNIGGLIALKGNTNSADNGACIGYNTDVGGPFTSEEQLFEVTKNLSGIGRVASSGINVTFKAKYTSLVFYGDSLTYLDIYGNGTRRYTHIVLREVPNHVETTQWT